MLALVKKHTPLDYYVWMEVFFKLLGLSPPQEGMAKLLYLLLAVPNIFICFPFLSMLEFYTLVRDFKENFKHTVLNLCVMVSGLVLTFRVCYFFFYRGEFDKIRLIVQRESFDFKCFSIRNVKNEILLYDDEINYEYLKRLWQNSKITLDEDSNEVDSYRVETMTHSRTLCCTLYILLNIWALSTQVASYTYAETSEEFGAHNTTISKRTYPLMVDLNFDIPLLKGHEWVLDMFQVYCNCARLLIFCSVLTVVTCTIVHLLGQTMVVNRGFRCVDKNLNNDRGVEMVLIREIRVVKCITELQEIYRAIKLLEDFCSLQLLVQYGSLTLILCLSCYVIARVNSVSEFMCFLIFQLACLGEILFFTYLCETLSLELQDILHPVYELDWDTYPLGLRRNLMILMHRSQRRNIITAGKILQLDLLFAIQVVQKAYSFYTLITNTTK